MAITRRQFLTRSGLATAGAMFGPSLFGSPWLQRAAAATIGDRYFVVLNLDGGNDGLNTIIPVSGGTQGLRTKYELARKAPSDPGGIRIENPLIPTPGAGAPAMLDPNSGTQLGFHPGLAKIRDMYESGMVAVLQGCGYPEYSLSHEVARSIWERGDPLTTPGSGWMGRYFGAAGYVGSDIPGVNIGGAVAGEFLTNSTSVVVFDRLADFGFPYDYDEDAPFKDDVLGALHASATANSHPFMQYLGGTGTSTLLATANYPTLHTLYTSQRSSWNSEYTANDVPGLGTSTARGFREIAKVIYGVAKGALPAAQAARFFELSNGGYDTHSNQGAEETDGDHYGLHQEIAASIKLFFEDLADMAANAGAVTGLQNLHNKVTVLVWSEFGRRIEQNDNGTDHGSQAPMLFIGGATAVNGGVYGNHPNITPQEDDATNGIDDDGNTRYSQDNANPNRSTDMRDVYGTIMKHWLGLANPGAILPLDSVLGYSGPDYWTAANFNMGFLP